MPPITRWPVATLAGWWTVPYVWWSPCARLRQRYIVLHPCSTRAWVQTLSAVHSRLAKQNQPSRRDGHVPLTQIFVLPKFLFLLPCHPAFGQSWTNDVSPWRIQERTSHLLRRYHSFALVAGLPVSSKNDAADISMAEENWSAIHFHKTHEHATLMFQAAACWKLQLLGFWSFRVCRLNQVHLFSVCPECATSLLAYLWCEGKMKQSRHFCCWLGTNFTNLGWLSGQVDDQTVSRYIRFLWKRAFIFPIRRRYFL